MKKIKNKFLFKKALKRSFNEEINSKSTIKVLKELIWIPGILITPLIVIPMVLFGTLWHFIGLPVRVLQGIIKRKYSKKHWKWIRQHTG